MSSSGNPTSNPNPNRIPSPGFGSIIGARKASPNPNPNPTSLNAAKYGFLDSDRMMVSTVGFCIITLLTYMYTYLPNYPRTHP